MDNIIIAEPQDEILQSPQDKITELRDFLLNIYNASADNTLSNKEIYAYRNRIQR